MPSYSFGGRSLLLSFSAFFLSYSNFHLLLTPRVQPFDNPRDFRQYPSRGRLAVNLLWPLLTSHDKLYSVLLTPFPHVHETSRGKATHFHSISPHYIHPRCPCNLWTSTCFAVSSHRFCLILFVFLRAEFCLQLPSDSTSRWTPLFLASG